MGLDVTAYRKIRKANNQKLDEDNYPVDESAWYPGAGMDWSESVWPGRGEGVDSKTVYNYEEKYEYSIGTYSYYGDWRRKLNIFVKKWVNVATLKSDFYELIEFADNEGVIGAKVSKKLYEDFFRNKELAAHFSDDIFDKEWLLIYHEFMKIFEIASDGGAVDF